MLPNHCYFSLDMVIVSRDLLNVSLDMVNVSQGGIIMHWESATMPTEPIYYVQIHFIMSREQYRCLGSMLSCLGNLVACIGCLLPCLESFIICLLSPFVCPVRLLACSWEQLPYLRGVYHVMGAS
jgi:hypothetical protein